MVLVKQEKEQDARMGKHLNNKLLLSLALLFLSACVTSAEHSNGEQYTAYFSDPKCKDYAYAEPITENDGDKREEKFGNAYCTLDDYINPETKEILNPAFIEEPLNKIFKDSKFDIESIDIASYYFTYTTLANLICEKAKTDDFTIRFLAQSTGKNDYDYVKFSSLKECLGKRFQLVGVGCDVFGDEKCSRKIINTMHTKLLAIRGVEGGQAVSHIFGGSANFRLRMSMDYDDMLYFKTPQGSAIDGMHQCIVDTMITANKKKLNKKSIRSLYKICTNNIDYKKQTVRPYFLPVEYKAYIARLLKSIRSADTIRTAIQVLGDERVRDALIKAAERGADVRVMTDNGWYYLTFGESFTKREAFDWGDTDSKNFERFLRPVMNSKVKVRFLETNFDLHRADNNYMHLRFVIASENNNHTVFTGSSHFKTGAFISNYENQYVINDSQLTSDYVEHFDQLWHRSLTEKNLPSRYVPSQYAKKKEAKR